MAIYVGDIGTKIRLNINENINAATVKQMKVKKPDGSYATWNSSIETNNYLVYNTVAGDLNLAGRYKIQAYLEIGTWKGHGGITEFEVVNYLG